MHHSTPQLFDIIICGSGPAGSTCALALADTGLKVAVLERHHFPRDKVCGDAVANYVPDVLRSINPRFKDALKDFHEKRTVNTIRMFAPNQKSIDICVAKDGFISMRMSWDNFLYDLASAQNNITYHLDHIVTDAAFDIAGVTVRTNKAVFKGKLLIGCDGAHSIVTKKTTGTKTDLNHYCGAVRAYYKNVSGNAENTFELHFIKNVIPGYFWIFPLNNNMTNVGLGILSATISKRKINLRETFDQIIQQLPYINNRFAQAERIGKVEGFGLPLGSRKVAISGNNFMLCGDAASLIDPLSGEGIGQAMISGRYAGWHAKKCFEQNNFSAAFMRQYDDQVYKKFWKTHRKNYFIQKLISDRHWLLNGAFNLSAKSNYIRSLLIKAIV